MKTLPMFEEQLARNAEEVSFLVCNNASDDGTDSFLGELEKRNPLFKHVDFKEHVPVGLSLSRAIDHADGEYVLMWGDDDTPAPFMIDALMQVLGHYPQAGLVHFNRMSGYDNKVDSISKLSVQQPEVGDGIREYTDMNSFLKSHVIDLTFMSSFVFKKSYWGGRN